MVLMSCSEHPIDKGRIPPTIKLGLVDMWKIVVIIELSYDTQPNELLKCEEGVIQLVAMYLMKDILDNLEKLVYVAGVPGMLKALD